MRRFWKQAAAVEGDGGWRIELDGRPVHTPARALLVVRQRALADAIAAEWHGAGETINARAMPITGLANAALDRVGPDKESFAAGLAKYGESDLLVYRAEGPQALVGRQSEHWDPLLTWARRRYDIDFVIATGVSFTPQPPATVERLSNAVRSLEPFALAGLSPMVSVGGSLIAALAVAEKAVSPDEGWTAVSLDEAWQLEEWGSDAEAEVAMENRRQDFLAGARFLDLLRD